MPIKHASIKHQRQTEKRTAANRLVKIKLKTLTKLARQVIAAKDAAKAKEVFQQLQQALDKAAKRHILHANAAARRKSRMMAKINALGSK